MNDKIITVKYTVKKASNIFYYSILSALFFFLCVFVLSFRYFKRIFLLCFMIEVNIYVRFLLVLLCLFVVLHNNVVHNQNIIVIIILIGIGLILNAKRDTN